MTVAGRGAHAVLRDAGGRIHAKFKTTLYLESPAGLACLGSEHIPNGPLNVKIPGFVVPPSRLTTWRFAAGTLILDDYRYSIEPISVWIPPDDVCVEEARLRDNIEQCQAILREPRYSSRLSPMLTTSVRAAASQPRALSGRLHVSIANALAEFASAIRAPQATEFSPAAVLSLLGVGEGLTPAGDDFLVGALVAMRAYERRTAAALSELICCHLERTHSISAAFLKAACDGEAIEPVHAAVHALNGHGEIGAAIEALAAFGHGSGFDALAGIVTVATAHSEHVRGSSRSPR